MAAICAVFLLRAALSVGDHVPYAIDFSEGWNAYHAEAAVSGDDLYPAPPGFMYNNYPPLSFYVVGALGRLLGDAIAAGRILSIIGFLLSGWFTAQAARRMGCGRIEAAWGAALYMTLLLMDYTYVGLNAPQLLGQAFGTAGLVLALGEPRTARNLIGSAVLFSVGFFIKPNLFFQPLAVVLWLLFCDRRNGIRLALYGSALFLGGCLAFDLAYGKSLWSQFDTPRRYDPAAALRGLAGWLELSAIPAMASVLLPLRFRDRHVGFCLLYFLLSLAMGTAFYGGAEVAGNVFFDAILALALCAAVGVNRLASAGRSLAFAACHFLPVVAGLAYLVATDSIAPRYWLEPKAPARLEAARDIAFLRQQDGPVMCSLLSLCYWAGKPGEIDTSITGQALLLGKRDEDEVARLFADEKFAALQLNPERVFERNPAIAQAVSTHYRLDHADMYGRFYVRKGAP